MQGTLTSYWLWEDVGDLERFGLLVCLSCPFFKQVLCITDAYKFEDFKIV